MAEIKPLCAKNLAVESKPLFVPPLNEVAKVLQDGLSKNFVSAEVNAVNCPNLRDAPFNLASEGLGGKERILDIGGVPYLIPLAQKNKLYDMRDYPSLTQMNLKEGEDALIIGAGAAPFTYIQRNAEMMPNLTVDHEGKVKVQKTTMARTMDDADETYKLLQLPKEESKMSLLGNLFLSEGKPSQVLEIKCRCRSGKQNFASCINSILKEAYPDKCIGLGGVFCATKGKLKIHVMPKFSEVPLQTDKDVENWLNFYEMDGPFTCLSVLVSNDPGLDLRLEHSHGFNIAQGQGGHYHYDTTPDIVEYTAYYNIAEVCYRVDRPNVTHMVGRD